MGYLHDLLENQGKSVILDGGIQAMMLENNADHRFQKHYKLIIVGVRDSLKNKIPGRGGTGEARAPSPWDFIFLLILTSGS